MPSGQATGDGDGDGDGRSDWDELGAGTGDKSADADGRTLAIDGSAAAVGVAGGCVSGVAAAQPASIRSTTNAGNERLIAQPRDPAARTTRSGCYRRTCGP